MKARVNGMFHLYYSRKKVFRKTKEVCMDKCSLLSLIFKGLSGIGWRGLLEKGNRTVCKDYA
jgi:hypothetical protein